MSSNEEDYNDGDNNPQGKKRRIQRACDICRRKKIRCDGVQMPGNRCSNCIAYSYDCTYIEAAKKRGPPKGYVESLENRLERMEKLLHRLCPDKDVLKGLEASLDNEAWSMENLPRGMDPKGIVAGHLQDKKGTMTPASPRDIATSVIRGVGNPVNTDDIQEEDFAHLLLVDNLKKLSIDPRDFRFFGKSSGAMLVQTAMELKNNYTGETHDLRRPILASKRPEFWEMRPWERKANEVQPPNYKFPDEDLILSLVELYFNHINLLLPLLHRPTFQKAVAEGLHRTDEGFGANLLLVCAVASRYSEDPRILLDGEESYHSSGWKWFNQVQVVKKSLLAPPTLYDLQFYCLSVQFLLGSSAPQSCWTMVGIGIRLAQDVGAHRRKFQLDTLAMEDELWKRAFWVLISMDRMVSSSLGRPCAIQDEDYDVDFPVECDDEYWDHDDPEQRFKQPANKPCLITCFILSLKLNQVITICLRTIYSINKSKVALGFVGQQWEQHIVAELDSALNKWVDSVPDYLRWDPNREDKRFFNQSASLFCTYYHTQILIHRPFIPLPHKPSPLAFPSLAICTNAARSCSHIIDIQRQRDLPAPPQVQMAVFTAGIVLLLNIWGGKRSGLSTDPNKEMADVYKCMQVLRSCENRWHSAGRLWDILYELASVGDLPLPKYIPISSNKRERDSDSPASASTTGSSPSDAGTDTLRPTVGSRRIARDGGIQPPKPHPRTHHPNNVQTQSQGHMQQEHEQSLFALPVYSNELGRLPLHGQVKFSPQGQSQGTQIPYWYPTPQSSSTPINSAIPPPNTAPASYSTADINMPGPFSIDGLLYDQMGINYSSPFPQSSASASSSSTMPPQYPQGNDLGVMLNPTGTGAGAGLDPHTMAMMHSGRFPVSSASTQALIDSDTIAMWNAPTGFELDDWGTYLTSVSELTHGFQHPPGDQPHQG